MGGGALSVQKSGLYRVRDHLTRLVLVCYNLREVMFYVK